MEFSDPRNINAAAFATLCGLVHLVLNEQFSRSGRARAAACSGASGRTCPRTRRCSGVFIRRSTTWPCACLRSRAAAEEVVQDTFVEVIRRIGDFRGEAPAGRLDPPNCGQLQPDAVALRLAQAGCAACRRGRSGRRVRILTARATSRILRAPCGSLSAKARTVVWLHDVEGLTHKEIGLLMGKTASFSKSQLARAHERLRVLLAGTTETEQCMQVPNSY